MRIRIAAEGDDDDVLALLDEVEPGARRSWSSDGPFRCHPKIARDPTAEPGALSLDG